MEYIHDLDQPTLKFLGLQLGLLQHTLSKLSDGTKPKEYGMMVMSSWLDQKDNVIQRGVPTWSTLANTLKKKSVGCSIQGDQILTDLREGTLSKK